MIMQSVLKIQSLYLVEMRIIQQDYLYQFRSKRNNSIYIFKEKLFNFKFYYKFTDNFNDFVFNYTAGKVRRV
jgi:hypothetical protein